MKVGILTFPDSTSYGATLQMYATSYVVNRLGHDAEIIHYHNAFMKADKHKSISAKKMVLKKISDLLHLPLKRKFRAFEKQKMNLFPKHPFAEKNVLRELGSRYGAVICGSDQVWNPDITGKDLSYFLDFCGENTRRISYAPSFGVKSLQPDFAALVTKELEQFHALCVREEDGQRMIRQMLGREVPIVLDPTMLLSQSDWCSCEEAHPLAQGPYILYYTIKRSESLMRFCRELSQKTGMKIIVVGGNPVTAWKNRDQMIEYAVDISPQQWLYFVHHAAYVVTNSFHGTAFSVNFRKNFYVEFSSLTNSRLEHIVRMLHLEDRVVNGSSVAAPSAVDYGTVDAILPSLVARSLQYLECALAEGGHHG